jgi:HEAT repeat protein
MILRALLAGGLIGLVVVSCSAPGYVKKLQSPDCLVRRQAAGELSIRKSPCLGAHTALIEVAMFDTDPIVREHAVKALGLYESDVDGVVPALRLALNDRSPLVRRAAAVALSCMDPIPSDALLGLARSLCDEDSLLKGYAETVFIELGPLGVAPLCRSLRNKDPILRYSAAQMLGKLGDDANRAIPALKRALNDNDLRVRLAASQSIANINQ